MTLGLFVGHRTSIAASPEPTQLARAMRIYVLAVGRLRPPFADDVQHYQKLLAGHARVEAI